MRSIEVKNLYYSSLVGSIIFALAPTELAVITPIALVNPEVLLTQLPTPEAMMIPSMILNTLAAIGIATYCKWRRRSLNKIPANPKVN